MDAVEDPDVARRARQRRRRRALGVTGGVLATYAAALYAGPRRQRWATALDRALRSLSDTPARLIRGHRVASAIAGVSLLLVVIKYQQAVAGAFRRLLRGFEPSPRDALQTYPEEEPVVGARGRRSSDADLDAPADVDERAVVESSVAAAARGYVKLPLHAGSDGGTGTGGGGADDSWRGVIDEAQRAGGLPPHAPAHGGDGGGGGARTALLLAAGAAPESPHLTPARAVEILRFIKLLRSTVHGIETEAILALYTRMDRLVLPAGAALFRAGDGNDDGMFIVVRGRVGLLADGDGDARPRPLCVFGRAQTIGENALLACPALTGRVRDDSGAPPFHATRAATCVALSEVEVLRLDKALFTWFAGAFPSAIASFVVSTTSRQWRVAAYLLVDVFRLADAWRTALEPPSTAPPFVLAPEAAARPFEAPPPPAAAPAAGGERSRSRYPAPVPLSAAALRAAAATVVRKSPGEPLVCEGDDADALFVLLSGTAVAHAGGAAAELGAPGVGVQYAAPGEWEAEAELGASLLAAAGLPRPSGLTWDGGPPSPAAAAGGSPAAARVVTRVLGPGCIAGGQACITGVPHRETVTATTHCEAAMFPRRQFIELCEAGLGLGQRSAAASTATSPASPPRRAAHGGGGGGGGPPARALSSRDAVTLEIVLAVGRSLVPLLRLFMALGLQRLWLRSGEVLFRAGDPLDGLYVVISGRLRTYVGADAALAVPPMPAADADDGDGGRGRQRVGGADEVGRAAVAASSSGAPLRAAAASGGSGGGNVPVASSRADSDGHVSLEWWRAGAADASAPPAGSRDAQAATTGAATGGGGGAPYSIGAPSPLLFIATPPRQDADAPDVSSWRGDGIRAPALPASAILPPRPTTLGGSDAAASASTDRGLVDVRRLGSFVAPPSMDGLAAAVSPFGVSSPRAAGFALSGADGGGGGGGVLRHGGASAAELTAVAAVAAASVGTTAPAAAVPTGPTVSSREDGATTGRTTAGGSLRVVRVDVGRGESVGEVPLLVGAKAHTSSAVCARDVELVRVTPAAFALITARYPAVMALFARVLARRVQALTGGRPPAAAAFAGAATRRRSLIGIDGGASGVGGIGGATSGGLGGSAAAQRNAATSAQLASPTWLSMPPHHAAAAAGVGAAAPRAVSMDDDVTPLARAPPPPPSAIPALLSHVPRAPAAPTFTTIAVVPAGRVPAPVGDFAARLVAALRRLDEGPVIHLTSAQLDSALGDGTCAALASTPVRAKASAWLSALEERYRFIVFEADQLDDYDDGGGGGGGGGGAWGAADRGSSQWRAPGRRDRERTSVADVARVLLRRVRDSAAAAAGPGTLLAGARRLGSRLDGALRPARHVPPSASTAALPTLRRSVSDGAGDGGSDVRRPRDADDDDNEGGGAGGYRQRSADAGGSRHAVDAALLSVLERVRDGGGEDGDGPSSQRSPSRRSRVSAWTKLCVQTADLAFLVGTAHTPPDLSPQEAEAVYAVRAGGGVGSPAVATPPAHGAAAAPPDGETPYAPRTFARKELVLLHPDAPRTPPSGSRFWLRPRRVAWHHHVRPTDARDFDRLARHVAGRAIAVVLGGGGSRGLAHLGVLRVLEERGVPVDVIGGTSQGAFMAAAYALTGSTRDCVPLVRKLAAGLGSALSLASALTLPVMTYFSGRAFNDTLIECFGPTQAEDLPTRFMCVSTDISNDVLAVHVSGPLWRYVRASMTLAGLLPPINDGGRLLVDGGYVQNLPVAPMRALAPQASVVVAVDVESKDQGLFAGVPPYGDHLSGWYIAWRWLLSLVRLGEPVRIPTTADLNFKLLYVAHSMVIRETMRDSVSGGGDGSLVFIQPDVGSKYTLFQYDRMDEIVAAGIIAARATFDGLAARNGLPAWGAGDDGGGRRAAPEAAASPDTPAPTASAAAVRLSREQTRELLAAVREDEPVETPEVGAEEEAEALRRATDGDERAEPPLPAAAAAVSSAAGEEADGGFTIGP